MQIDFSTPLPTSSQLFRRAAGIDPQGSPAPRDCKCAMCAAQLKAGDPVNAIGKDTFGESFNNKLDIHEAGDVLCGDCAALWQRDFLMKYSKTYATPSGVFKLASNEDIQAFILTPPRPPFVAVYNTRQQQHMIWRTPLCLSNEVLIVRLDDEILHIDRDKVLRAVSAWQRTLARMKELGFKGLPAYPERTLSSRATGSIRDDVAERISGDSEAGARDIETLRSLRVGEWWAMCAINKVDLDSPASWPLPVKLLPA
ncbi:type IV CRISPR-associated protein Csf1 [Diaphorobacter sp. J5-51]|uniref:type IV CRISPR-associated protein Csf1 n=1 Tax=Diaphorobacter sp. J5-51 TaxID=680496 RepID=UPI001F16B366|nr:type IV CRISPR-associated protein Csf1 [Diaphorobacter sp. J5-51]